MSMRYTQRLRLEAIPQWRSCYINYEHLKNLVKTIRDTVRQRLELQDLMNFGMNIQARTLKTISLKTIEDTSPKMEDIKSRYAYFEKATKIANEQFCTTWQKNMELYGDFVKWKFKEIETNFHACWKTNFIIDKGDENIRKKLMQYLQFIFVQSLYLNRMIQSNLEAEKRILAKHKLYATGVFETPDSVVQNYVTVDDSHKLRRQIERFYFRVSNKPKQANRYKLRKLAEQDHIEVKQSLLIGLLLGALVAVIIFISIILQRSNITLQSNTIFNKDFTLWRGIAIFIFYIWVLGADFSYFEKYKVSMRIILRNNYPEYPISSDFFKVAGVFSIIFIIVFTIYSLQIAGILQIGGIAPQWLPLFVWGPFLLFLFNPLPILYPYGRMFFFKKIFLALTSVFTLVDFPKIWITAQAISLLNVFQDLFYAICFYTHLQFPYDPTVNVCKTPAINARFAYTVVIYMIRIIQCIKVGCGQGSGLRKSEFLNSIKFSLSLLTAILAYVWKQVNNPYVFPAWLTFAIISTLSSFLWDYKIGWDLDFTNKKHRFLRDDLIYPQKNYYFWLVINFFFRFAWTLNISPNVVRQFMGGSPEIITMSFAFVELIRRGFWNLVRIEVDQIRNNNQLQALSKQKQKYQKQIYSFISENKERVKVDSMQNLMASEKIMVEVEEKQEKDLGKQKQKIVKEMKQFSSLIEEQRSKNIIQKREIEVQIDKLLNEVY